MSPGIRWPPCRCFLSARSYRCFFSPVASLRTVGVQHERFDEVAAGTRLSCKRLTPIRFVIRACPRVVNSIFFHDHRVCLECGRRKGEVFPFVVGKRRRIFTRTRREFPSPASPWMLPGGATAEQAANDFCKVGTCPRTMLLPHSPGGRLPFHYRQCVPASSSSARLEHGRKCWRGWSFDHERQSDVPTGVTRTWPLLSVPRQSLGGQGSVLSRTACPPRIVSRPFLELGHLRLQSDLSGTARKSWWPTRTSVAGLGKSSVVRPRAIQWATVARSFCRSIGLVA